MNETATPDSGKYSVFNAMIDIVAAPGKALDEARHNVRWLWWPLLVVIAFSVGVFAFYYSWVDFDWYVDEMIRLSTEPGTDPAQLEQMRSFFSPGTQIGTTAIGIIVVVFVIYAIQSAYLHLVNKVVGDPEISYGQWFAFSSWTGFVGIFNAFAVLAVLLMADTNQVGPDQLAPLSMNALFIHADPMSPWAAWGNSLTLVHFWILGLMTYGFSRWTRSGMVKSAAVAIAPWALIYGAWALMI